MSDMTFDSGRMELYVASDVANHHANSLSETAAEIHMLVFSLQTYEFVLLIFHNISNCFEMKSTFERMYDMKKCYINMVLLLLISASLFFS